MKTHYLLRKNVQLWCLFVSLSVTPLLGQDARPPLPSWVAGRSDLLPEITLSEYNIMKDVWPKTQLEHMAIFNPPPEFWESLQIVAEMGEKSVQALVWLYVQDPPRINPEGEVRDEYLIRTVFLNDTTSVRWVLPILRYRLQWMESLLARGEHERLLKVCDELGAIQGYLNIRGDEEDYRNVMNFINRLALVNDNLRRRLDVFVGPEYDVELDKLRRIGRSQQLLPYHEWAKLALSSRKDPAKNGGGTEDASTLGNSTSKASPLVHKPHEAKLIESTPIDESISTTLWSMIVVMIVAVTGLLWLLVKKRK